MTSLSKSGVAIRTFSVPPEIEWLGSIRSVKTDWMASARLRTGLAWQRFLFYGTGGAAFADTSVYATDSLLPVFVPSPKDEEIVIGWTAGVGVEWALAKGFSLGLEYRHSDFGGKNFNLVTGKSFFLVTPNSRVSPRSIGVDFIDDQVTLRVNLLFNGLFRR